MRFLRYITSAERSIGINCVNGQGLSLPFYIEPVSESTGTMVIDVCDENTYYTAEKPHVSGAYVTVSHPTTGAIVTTGTTGEDGKFQVVLPEGYYAVSVSAPSIEPYLFLSIFVNLPDNPSAGVASNV